jgi:hypothetical protein
MPNNLCGNRPPVTVHELEPGIHQRLALLDHGRPFLVDPSRACVCAEMRNLAEDSPRT